jgi:cytochrome c oxidase assembly protein subunit 15
MNQAMRLRRLLKIEIILVFFLLLLGNTVRNMKAGLSCPDWPLCYDKIIPPFNILVAYEFSHRVFAGFISIIFLILTIQIFKLPQKPSKNLKMLSLFGCLILVVQIILGGLTVLKLLDAYIVAMHLTTGLLFFAILLLLKFLLDKNLGVAQASLADKKALSSIRFFSLSIVNLIGVFLQSILGGLVASNYAGLACQGFPSCNGKWWGDLASEQIQMIHRYGAFVLASLIIYMAICFYKVKKTHVFESLKVQTLVNVSLFLLVSQFIVGILNVYMQVPVFLSILHLAVAALLIGTFLKISVEVYK